MTSSAGRTLSEKERKQKEFVENFLSPLNLIEEYATLLLDYGYDTKESIELLTETDLKDMKIKPGHIKRILPAVQSLKQASTTPITTTPTPTPTPTPTTPTPTPTTLTPTLTTSATSQNRSASSGPTLKSMEMKSMEMKSMEIGSHWIDVDEIIPPPSDAKTAKLLGRGSFGMVYEAKYRGFDVAVKVFTDSLLDDEITKEIIKECNVMHTVPSPNIARLYGFTLGSNTNSCLVMELAERGSLFSILQDTTQYPDIPWSRRLEIAIDILKGLCCLHGQRILHRDLKSLNVLLRRHWSAFLCDFGFARFKDPQSVSLVTLSKGTQPWMAPETLNPDIGPNGPAADIFSFGMILYELLTRKIPFGIEKLLAAQVSLAIVQGRRPLIPEESKCEAIKGCPEGYIKIMEDCWDQVPTKRPTGNDILLRLQQLQTAVCMRRVEEPVHLLPSLPSSSPSPSFLSPVLLSSDSTTPSSSAQSSASSPPSDLNEWTPSQFRDWLCEGGYSESVRHYENKQMDAQMLLSLVDLSETCGSFVKQNRETCLKWLKEVGEPSSTTPLPTSPSITPTTIVASTINSQQTSTSTTPIQPTRILEPSTTPSLHTSPSTTPTKPKSGIRGETELQAYRREAKERLNQRRESQGPERTTQTPSSSPLQVGEPSRTTPLPTSPSTSPTTIQWQWKNALGAWIDYAPDVSEQLEQEHEVKDFSYVGIIGRAAKYTIFFNSMEQIATGNGEAKPVRRIVKNPVVQPSQVISSTPSTPPPTQTTTGRTTTSSTSQSSSTTSMTLSPSMMTTTPGVSNTTQTTDTSSTRSLLPSRPLTAFLQSDVDRLLEATALEAKEERERREAKMVEEALAASTASHLREHSNRTDEAIAASLSPSLVRHDSSDAELALALSISLEGTDLQRVLAASTTQR